MKSTLVLIVFTFALPALAANVGQSPRKQLASLVEQLKEKPGDNALREKAIALAKTLKPELPEEAERRLTRGRVAFDAADYPEAIKEFEQAAAAAPWHGDAYFKLGTAQDKAGDYEGALRSLKLAHLASRRKEIKALIYEVEYRNEKWNAPAARAAREAEESQRRSVREAEARAAGEKEAQRRFLASFDGFYDCGESQDWYGYAGYKSHVLIKNGIVDGVKIVTWFKPGKASPNEVVGFRPMWFWPNEFPIQGASTTARDGTALTSVQINGNLLEWVTDNTSSPGSKMNGTCRR